MSYTLNITAFQKQCFISCDIIVKREALKLFLTFTRSQNPTFSLTGFDDYDVKVLFKSSLRGSSRPGVITCIIDTGPVFFYIHHLTLMPIEQYFHRFTQDISSLYPSSPSRIESLMSRRGDVLAIRGCDLSTPL